MTHSSASHLGLHHFAKVSVYGYTLKRDSYNADTAFKSLDDNLGISFHWPYCIPEQRTKLEPAHEV